MGMPQMHYETLLYNFACKLADRKDKNLLKEIDETSSVSAYEEIIFRLKEEMPEKKFYYIAGLSAMETLQEVTNEYGIDGLNACLASISMFEELLGLK